MGNCCAHQQSCSTEWGGDDWGSPVAEQQEKVIFKKMEEEGRLLGGGGGNLTNSTTTTTTITTTTTTSRTPSNALEVKIKITKKQLQELLSRVDINDKELSAQQVLAQLMSFSDGDHHHQQQQQQQQQPHDDDHDEMHQRSWRPNLQSIPE